MHPDFENFFDADTLTKAVSLYELLTIQKPFVTADLNFSENQLLQFQTNKIYPENVNQNENKISVQLFVWGKLLAQLTEMNFHSTGIQNLYAGLLTEFSEAQLLQNLKQHPEYIERLQITEHQKEKIRNYLNTESTIENQQPPVSILLLLIAQTIVKRETVSIAVFSDGSFIPLAESLKQQLSKADVRKMKNTPYLTLSVSATLAHLIGDEKTTLLSEQIGIISTAEKTLLENIRSGKYSSITVTFKNSKLDLLELTKDIDTQTRITDILAENEYQTITVKQHRGKKVVITNTIKLKLSSE
jgi:hypothetical protein